MVALGYPLPFFWVSEFPYEITNPEKGALIIIWLLGCQGVSQQRVHEEGRVPGGSATAGGRRKCKRHLFGSAEVCIPPTPDKNRLLGARGEVGSSHVSLTDDLVLDFCPPGVFGWSHRRPTLCHPRFWILDIASGSGYDAFRREQSGFSGATAPGRHPEDSAKLARAPRAPEIWSHRHTLRRGLGSPGVPFSFFFGSRFPY